MKHYLQCLVYLQLLANNSWSDTVSAVPVVQSPSCVRLFATPWTAARQASLSLSISRSLPKFMSIELVMPCNHIILCRHFLLMSSIFPSIRVISKKSEIQSGSQSIGTSASASVLPMNIQDWFPLGWTGWISLQSRGLARVFSSTTVQMHYSSASAFFMAQPSHSYMTTGKITALTIQIFVGKAVSLYCNTLSRFVIAFLQGASIFLFHGFSHCPHWFWNPRK